MKKTYEIHVPTEQFGFIACTIEGESEDAWEEYINIASGVGGLPEKEYRELYDKVAKNEPIQADPGILDRLNAYQRLSLRDIKNFVKRNK
jgi:hypothetical protein